ncbi:MAG: hypothetical protein K2X74_13160, partial [Acetobacteraceae bacterium]|nr:hypothetical protein [Acetobacteraceae bacterium]
RHVNHPPRPGGVPAWVAGPRIYLWQDNARSFRPDMLGLPYARPLDRKHQNFDNAIRHVAQLANITLPPGPVPDYPRREGLFG